MKRIFFILLIHFVFAGFSVSITRGPYLQVGTSNSIIIRWRTAIPTNSMVKFGIEFTSQNQSVSDTSTTIEHIVRLKNLSPNTKYYYSIGSAENLISDSTYFFSTSPIMGAEQTTRVWVSGDCGNNSTNQRNVRDQYYNFIGTKQTNLWLLLGDNAYESGTDAEYQTNFFDIYKDKALQQFVLWPAPGNHDYANGDPNRQNDHLIPYYDIFSVPTKGEAGGFPSYKKAYYSFDYANIHFISLDSYGNENAKRLYDTTGAQVAWLKKDLETNKLPWVIAYWHHPPYTMSSHNSDTEPELVQLRTDFIKMLERYNIDLVLCGHSHDYERSYLMKGHYGPEATFDSTIHRLSTSSAKYNGSPNSCPYLKSEPTQTKGTVYVVAGSAGKVGGYQAEYPHNAMYYSDVTHGGSMYLEITGNRLDAKFLCADGVIRDHFSMLKEVNKTSKISTTKGENVTLTASWTGNYVWSPGGERTKSISINAQNNASYSVSDSLNCLLDKFEITINTTSINIDETLPAINRDRLFVLKKDSNHEVYIFNKSIKAFVYDTNGKQVSSINNSKQLNTSNLPNGTYFVQTDSNERLKISIFR